MKKFACLLILLALFLCGCDSIPNGDADGVFHTDKDGNIVDASGVAYSRLAYEGYYTYLGELEFLGGVSGEPDASWHGGVPYQTGMFAIKGEAERSILIRQEPNNEWASIYREASLPAMELSVDRCIRLELVRTPDSSAGGAVHVSCGGGITETDEIAAFLADVRSQPDPEEAGLYDLMPDDSLEICYLYGTVYGFYEEEPQIALRIEVWSYHDLAYSVSIPTDGEEKCHVLPAEWLARLREARCGA